MLLTKLKFYILLQLLAIAVLLTYQGMWLISNTTEGRIENFGSDSYRYKRKKERSGSMTVSYKVNGITYKEEYTRNETPLTQKTVCIRYLLFAPSISNLDSFIGQWLGSLIVLLIFFLASSMLLLLHNTVFSKGTLFELNRRFPFIQMHEFFPHNGKWQQQRHYWRRQQPPANTRDILDDGSSSA